MSNENKNPELWGENYHVEENTLDAVEESKDAKAEPVTPSITAKFSVVASLIMMLSSFGFALYIFIRVMPHAADGINPFDYDEVARGMIEALILYGSIGISLLAIANIVSLFKARNRSHGIVGLVMNIVAPLLVLFAWLVLVVF